MYILCVFTRNNWARGKGKKVKTKRQKKKMVFQSFFQGKNSRKKKTEKNGKPNITYSLAVSMVLIYIRTFVINVSVHRGTIFRTLEREKEKTEIRYN